jgi:hypothetical protein
LTGWMKTFCLCLDRNDLRLSVLPVLLGDAKRPTWCWFIYECVAWSIVAQGTCDTPEEAQLAASTWADRHIGRVCARCGLTETEIEQKVNCVEAEHYFPKADR